MFFKQITNIAIHPAIGLAKVDDDDTQAAKFIIHALDKEGNILGEINSSHAATVRWQVSIANKAGVCVDESNTQAQATQKVILQLANQSISGTDVNEDGRGFYLRSTNVSGDTVNLGQLQTDEYGHLIFIPGSTKTDSKPDNQSQHQQENKPVFDAICDGAVDATVTLPDRRVLIAQTAWVVTTPANCIVDVQAPSKVNDEVKLTLV